MAPANKQKPGKKAGLSAEEAPESLLQAVVLADSFNKRFRPLTLEKPRCLLPLANTPLIEYTLEFLALGGVQEIFLYCCAHADMIQQYIQNSKWSRPSSPFDIHIVESPSSTSVGDVMRELDQTGLIKTDFILISGDIVSNVPLQPILEEHKARRLIDKNCIMTTILRETSADHRTKPRGEGGIFTTDIDGKQILHYEALRQSPTQERVGLPKDLVRTRDTFLLHGDLLDCCIDILSFEVPPLFTENFDWQHSRKDFLHGILMDELYGKTVYCHILKSGYAGRVQSLHTYDSVTRDIINRWTYPFCPDSNLLDGQTYKYSRGHLYKEADVILAQSAVIKEGTIIGAGTNIGHGTIVASSSIGRNCIIGKNVKLDGAMIWDNVVIGDNCTIGNAIIASEAHINDGCTIATGAVVSYGVVVEKGTDASCSTKFTQYTTNTVRDERGYKKVVLSKTKNLIEYEESEESEEEKREIAKSGLYYRENTSDSNLSDMSTLSEDEKGKKKRRVGHSRNASENDIDMFSREALHSLLGSLKAGHSVDIMILELNSLRMAANADFNDVRRATAAAVITYMHPKVTSNAALVDVVEGTLKRLLPLFNRMIFETSDQVQLMGFMQKELAGKERGGAILQRIAMTLYNDDLCDDAGILHWWNGGKSLAGETPEMAKVREGVRPFCEWLIGEGGATSSSEEDDEDDEDDGDEDDDDEDED
ncbi:hypothetical protein Dda_2315 [Drechslerella dactyloides]|uniref:Mannose-1-phosphate guanyltransferase n=1 Tax=Drechslerella dactyloides TaxID=74499 RepID=A0AAD6J5N7_DREDA|nr:hypothetical protein Dda_2315 [Drechslerella dactyloides]